jgi:hypothetical protein
MVEYWFKGMKYRTKNVQRRQKSFVSLAIISITVATSLLSANAITKSDRDVAAMKAQLTQPVQNTEISNAQPGGLWVTGDSVILGIHYELEKRSHIALINARVGRQAAELLTVMQQDKLHVDGSPVIFDLGNNNRLTEAEVAAIFEVVKNQPQIIVVNTAVPRGWREDNNVLIAKYAQMYGATLIDWAAISNGHPEYFAPDGVHLVPTGVQVYVEAITSQLITK